MVSFEVVWWGLVALGGNATSVSPEAQSPNGCDERRGESSGAPQDDTETEEERQAERHKYRWMERRREMKTGWLCARLSAREEGERSGVVKKMGWVNLGELWCSINIVLLPFTEHCPLSQHGSAKLIQCTWHCRDKGPGFPSKSFNPC